MQVVIDPRKSSESIVDSPLDVFSLNCTVGDVVSRRAHEVKSQDKQVVCCKQILFL